MSKMNGTVRLRYNDVHLCTVLSCPEKTIQVSEVNLNLKF